MPRPLLALAAMLLVQTLVALASAAAPVLAPAVAPELGFAPERVGVYAAVSYLCAMLTGLRSGTGVARLGAVRLNQAALLGCLAGAGLAALGSGDLILVVAALVGAGYGVVNPAAAAVLAHHAPARSRGLYFSIKQSGVPLGVGLAGLLLPAGLAVLGWRTTLACLAAACLVALLVLAGLRARLEPPRTVPPGQQEERARALLARVWRAPVLRAMSLASVAFAVSQQVYVTFLVAMLHLHLQWSLAAAAGVLALSQALSVAARIALGALGDSTGKPGLVLAGVGAAMALALVLLGVAAAFTPPGPDASRLAVMGASLACAATAMGWNGVFFGALARQVSQDDLPRVAGATQFFTFGGGMLGPLAFGEALRLGAPYAACYAAAALVPAAAAVVLARALRAAAPPPRPSVPREVHQREDVQA